ncbi:hypothetical protein ACFIQF_19240 [Comamonas sp. J-3]|uniref:hypothetical protein n=1 Tax=Comamonas trifloxystrobinivorans TaxID=3350256 RepID=UPI00372B1530
MNIIKGLKRLYIVLSLLIVVGVTGTVWADSARLSCRRYQQMGILDRAAELGVAAPCTTDSSRFLDAAIAAAGTAIILTLVWFIFRWIIAGFFPTRSSKK